MARRWQCTECDTIYDTFDKAAHCCEGIGDVLVLMINESYTDDRDSYTVDSDGTFTQDDQGNWNSWHSSAHDMKEVAKESWIKVVGNKQMGGYDPVDPLVPITQETTFPGNLNWHEIVHLAFRRHLIEKEDHPIIRRILEG